MIGFYDYTVILTYLGLISSVVGMTQAIEGRFRIAILCLAISGLCDMFDGKVARKKADRSQDEKLFGVQIDSLCDVICFGVFPATICYMLGVRGAVGRAVIAYYCVCSVIRLAYFNVLETNRQQQEDGANKYYHGLPITTMSIVLPIVFLLHIVIPAKMFVYILTFTLALVGTLFVVDFRLKKPNNKTLSLIVAVVACAVVAALLFSRYRIPKGPMAMHSSENKVEAKSSGL